MRLIWNSGSNKVLRQLTEAEAESVRRYCGAGLKTEPQDVRVVAALLAEMHNGKEPRYWLECDCRDAEKSDQRPRMTARIRGDGPRHFVRLAGRDAHQCSLQAFRTDPSEDEDDELEQPGKHRPLLPIVNPLEYLDRDFEAGGKRPGGPSSGGIGSVKGKKIPRLGRILYTVLDQAGFSSITTAELGATANPQRSWERLETFAGGEAMKGPLTLNDLLFTKPWIKPEEMLAKVDNLEWPKGKKRSAFLLFVADEVSSTAATKFTRLGPKIVAPATEIRIGGRDQNFANPPYWVLAVVDRNDDGAPRVREAFAQHALEKDRPVPLDSSYERHTLAQLLKVMEWVKKKGLSVTLRKPLFDSEVPLDDGEVAYCRADFELEVCPLGRTTTAGRILIESMGSESQEYLDQKSTTHAIMRRRGALIEHEVRHDDQQADRDDWLRRRVYGRLLELAGVPRPAAG
ncbi:hypothetical protein DOT66_24910 [Ralstonia pseudosolanacearum]|uniref:hypothetical protein n=1 Tax=Ralstonia pseudosolanacearum TaxID=1310165 RepID=UPI000A62A996|nr:hypothetical protein [Ralstonia pseudosolanacearum]AZU59723.1 hypothetical protein CFM90_26205 [Ralstonia solanacearum]NKF92331.1 hypothetical protein [Ralstonia solanacearum]NKG07106.1 hypothetical protein [Ralstonia solanacearum]RAA04546.1 hypothetical protein DOT66_24910 [Ralstonia pseudosolanacearum]